jgi:HEAT repeat protein
VQRMAARLLGRTRVPAARARLVEALRDRDARVRVLGAVGLGYSDDKTAIPLLVQALKDGDPKVRAAAAWALGAIH